jgi:hypothetical protein
MAYSNIAECLLEMHYFRVLVRQYRRVLGREIQVFKPATNAEHWYGFDQAFFTADMPKPEVIKDLKQFIQSSAAPRFTSFRAFLLQFKVVEVITKRSAHSPRGWTAPYLRSELSLAPNRKTRISQHEALRRLSALAGASVAYVCPMILEENDVLNRPRLRDLRFVDVSSSPTGWLTNEKHFIAFQTSSLSPTWCSEPVPGKALELRQVYERTTQLTADGLFDLLARIQSTLLSEGEGDFEQDLLRNGKPNTLPTCLSVVAERPRENQRRR